MKHLITALFLMGSAMAFGECVAPEVPVMPDGSVADLPTMVEGQKAVKAYVAAVEGEYLPCLEAASAAAAEAEAGTDGADEAAAARAAVYNAAVDKVTEVGAAFNAEIGEYKAKAAQQ